jgi:LysR family transcriptional regulator, nitrogen assimilation regulatory protein
LNALTPVGSTRNRLPEAMSHAGGPVGLPDFRELRYFAAAARAGNLGRAAQELGVTGSAISQQLRKLEDALGTPLLLRHGRGVTPTPAGAALLERIDTIVRLLAAPLDPEHAGAAAGGTVSLALPAEFSAVLGAPVIAALHRRWPAVTPHLHEDGSGSTEQAVLRRQVDIALLAEPPDLDELSIEPVLTDRLGLVVAPSASLADRSQPLRLRDLAGVKLIMPGPLHWIRHHLARAGFQRGVRIEPAFQVDGVAVAKELVRNGLGCAVLPAAAVRDETARGALVFRPLEPSALTVAVATRQMPSALVRDIARTVAETVRSLAESNAWPGAQPVRPPELVPEAASPGAAFAEPLPTQDVWPVPLRERAAAELELAEGD